MPARPPLTPATLVAHPGVTTASVNGVANTFFDRGTATWRYELSPLALEILALFAEPADVAEVLRTMEPGRRDRAEATIQDLCREGFLSDATGGSAMAGPNSAQCRRLLAEMAGALDKSAADLMILAEADGGHVPTPPAAARARRLRQLHAEMLAWEAELAEATQDLSTAQFKTLELSPGAVRVNIGAGDGRLPGWIALDAKGSDLRANLLRPLPFPDETVDLAYMSHVLEHFRHPGETVAVLQGIRRILKPGGVLRIVVPDLEACLTAYARGDREFFRLRHQALFGEDPAGTSLEAFLHYAGAEPRAGSFMGHRFGFDRETLSALVERAGFEPRPSAFMESAWPDLRIDHVSEKASAAVRGTRLSLFMDAVVPDRSAPTRGKSASISGS
jgi:SAM-dependent methyltransferase